jgi:hypothetical protein
MRTHLLAAVATAALLAAFGTTAAFADDPAPAADAKPAKAKKGKAKGSGSAAAAAPAAAAKADAKPAKGKKGKKGKATAEPAPAPAPLTPPAPPPPTTVTIKAPPPPAPAPAPLAPPPAPEVQAGPADDDAPTIAHTPITKAPKGKPLVFTARMQDPSGIFQPVLYLRKRGTGDFIPIKMIGSKVTQGDYAVEADAKLISVDLEYYIECYDNAGNGPSRAGSPDNPLVIKLELPPPPPVVVVAKGEKPPEAKPAGAPPAISHSTVSKAIKGQSVEIAAKLVGDTGVSNAKVFFRHVGEKEFKELPMGNIGGDDYTASMPPIVVTGDLEYYLEAFDRHGNGPGRSGGPHVPYTITVTEKPPEPAPVPVVIKTTPGEEKPGATATPPPPPPVAVRPRLVKAPFKPNPGRWAAWIAMGGFIGSLTFAGGEAYSAWSTDQVYQHTFNVDGRLLPDLHQKSLDDSKRAKIFGIAAAGSLVVGITLLLIFPEFPETQLVSGSGGDLTLVRF